MHDVAVRCSDGEREKTKGSYGVPGTLGMCTVVPVVLGTNAGLIRFPFFFFPVISPSFLLRESGGMGRVASPEADRRLGEIARSAAGVGRLH
ncbi:hypothetical protein MTO96_036897 [Rhipicephalus appendiculatus]